MEKSMRAAVVTQDRTLEVRTLPVPDFGPYEALVAMRFGATCAGTDQRVIDHGPPRPLRYPGVLGHESVGRVVAVGEIGLDYFYDLSPRDQQREVLIKQLALARRMNVPAVFHVRDAHGDMLEVLRERRGELPAGVMHCYSGSVESAKEYLDLGFYLSFAGPVTFKNAHKLQEAARFCPADRLLVETDSPYLTPVPLRGKRNEPAFVQYVAEVVAQLRGVSTEKLADTAARNACRLFGIPEE